MGVKVDLRRIMAVSAALRVLLVAYGEWQDAHMEVRYTDVDYLVFSDAAALVAAGGSPFERSTYRYSPLLAFILLPNSTLHHCWGKLLFSAADLLVGYFVHAILELRGVPETLRLYSVAAWLFNPFTFTIGTRGNCEPIVCAMLLWIIICLLNRATHFRQHFGMDFLSTSESILSYIHYLSLWFSMNMLSSMIRVVILSSGVLEKETPRCRILVR